MANTDDLLAKFMARVGDRTDCWEWTGSIDAAGYARLGRDDYGHRLSHELFIGPIGAGLQVDHKCRNRACVNPKHLHAVTPKQNLENLAGATAANRSTGVRNVYLHKPSGRFRVQIGHRGSVVHGGYYATLSDAEEAALALRNRMFTNNLADRRSNDG